MGGGSADAGASDVKQVAGVNFLAKSLAGIDAKDLKGLADEAKANLGSASCC